MSAPLDTKDYKVLKRAGLDEVYCWQETYNRGRYEEVHPPSTPKHDYLYRTRTFERVLEAGIQRYGMGVLFGLYNWEYDVLALLGHAKWLEDKFGIAPYAFGVPRFKGAHGALRQKPFYRVTNKMYRLSVAVFRLAFPHAQTYLNTREHIGFIYELLKGGGSELNIEASTYPGGYTDGHKNGQFFHYSYDSEKIFKILRNMGLEPSFR
jgi:2-iminoacetate synthase